MFDEVIHEFTPLDKASSTSISCTRQLTTNESVLCDVGLFSSKIYEVRLKLDAATGKLAKDAQVEYNLYGDTFSREIKSSPYFIAVNTASFENSFFRIQIFKRTSVSGNSTATQAFYSADLTTMVSKDKRAYNEVPFNLYMYPGSNDTQLMIEDSLTGAVAKIYNVTEAVIQTGSIGYYDQLRLMDVLLTINDGMVVKSSHSLYSAFFNPNGAPISINDVSDESFFMKYLWIWITIGSVILVAVIVALLYFCRRETIDKYKITL